MWITPAPELRVDFFIKGRCPKVVFKSLITIHARFLNPLNLLNLLNPQNLLRPFHNLRSANST